MTKTMAEVLAEQLCGWNEDAPCADCLDDAKRYLGVLSDAGFGLVADAKAEALEEAVDDFSVNLTVMSGPRIRAWLSSKAAKYRAAS